MNVVQLLGYLLNSVPADSSCARMLAAKRHLMIGVAPIAPKGSPWYCPLICGMVGRACREEWYVGGERGGGESLVFGGWVATGIAGMGRD